jgi:hypothetical protein
MRPPKEKSLKEYFRLKATSRILEGCRGQLEDLKEVTALVGVFPVALEPVLSNSRLSECKSLAKLETLYNP